MVCACSVVSDSVTLWTVACQAPLSTGFSREEYWSGLPFPSPMCVCVCVSMDLQYLKPDITLIYGKKYHKIVQGSVSNLGA